MVRVYFSYEEGYVLVVNYIVVFIGVVWRFINDEVLVRVEIFKDVMLKYGGRCFFFYVIVLLVLVVREVLFFEVVWGFGIFLYYGFVVF